MCETPTLDLDRTVRSDDCSGERHLQKQSEKVFQKVEICFKNKNINNQDGP